MARYQFITLRRFVVAGLLSSCVALASPSSPALAADGDLDLSFSGDGIVTDNYAGNDDPFDIALQSDGKIVIAGSVDDGTNDNFFVARYNTDGTRDNTFDSDGIAYASLGSGSDSAKALAIQSDGKIIVAGSTNQGGTVPMGVVRFNSNGSLDTSFSGDGKLTIEVRSPAVEDVANDVLIQSDGKIILVGSSWDNTNLYYEPAVVQLATNGTVEVSTIIETNQYAIAYGGALQSDGKIVVTGMYESVATGDDFAVWRLNASGTPDTSFSDDGQQVTPLSATRDIASAVAIQSDGKIVVGGYGAAPTYYDFSLARFNSNGTLDSTFSGDGKLQFATGTRADLINDIVIQSDGKIVAVGQTTNSVEFDISIARVTSSGELDTSFSSDGIHVQSIGASHDTGIGAVIQGDNKILVLADYIVSSQRDIVLFRLNSSSSLSALSNLTLSAGSLVSAFSSSTTSYSASVSHETTSITVTPVVAESYASVSVSGSTVTSGSASSPISLAVGANSIPIVVTAQDGTTKTTYTVTVTRAPSTNAALSGVSLSGVTLSPSFSSSTTSYTATVSNGTKSLTVTPTVSDSTATAKVNGTVVASGSASSAIALSPGSNTITVVGTAQDGVTTKTYTFIITRDVATVKLKKTITAKNVLKSRDVTLASTSKVVVTVKASSKKYCSVTGSSVKGVKKGNCTVVVAVTPKATKTVKKPKTTKTTVTLRVV